MSRRSCTLRPVLAACAAALLAGCPPTTPPDDSGRVCPGFDDGCAAGEPKWTAAFDATGVGALSSVWGSSASDVFAVGGTPEQGEVYHFDGSSWTQMSLPTVPLLVWVYGFGPDNVYAVGTRGAALHYDGTRWTALSSGTQDDLWGVWGAAPNDLWIVGGSPTGGAPVLMHFDGARFAPVAIPPLDRPATAFFKVWGIGGKVFAVGSNGVIIEKRGDAWSQVDAGPRADDDFVSLWGTSESEIVAVGGRSSARIAIYNGESWETLAPPGVPGLNGVCMLRSGEAIVDGLNGFVGRFDVRSRTLAGEPAPTTETLHAVWGADASRVFAVGGRFSPPFHGVALLRTLGEAAAPAPITGKGAPVLDDCNRNGLPDAEDLALGRSADCNGDGVPDECQPDADSDGVPDDCDRCPGGDDRVDSDGDGQPDACDVCPLGDDRLDADGDGVPNACDKCPGFDDRLDADGDGVPDGCDVCTGNDIVDSDGDGVPDACDKCPGSNDKADADGDGVPDGCDRCPGFSDKKDADGDGKPDACDPCPVDPLDDSDGDGVCDSQDICPGFDDKVDTDCDGVPDGCDPDPGVLCAEQADCPLGTNCVASGACGAPKTLCLPTSQPDMILGQGSASNFAQLAEGGTLYSTPGFQGFVDAYISLKAVNLCPPGVCPTIDGTIVLTITLLNDDGSLGEVVATQNGQVIKLNETQVAPGVLGHAVFERHVIIFKPPASVNQKKAVIDITVTDTNNPGVSTSVKQKLLISVL